MLEMSATIFIFCLTLFHTGQGTQGRLSTISGPDQIKTGQSLTLTCSVYPGSEVSRSVAWSLNGHQTLDSVLQRRGSLHTANVHRQLVSTLTIPTASPQDSGVYTCNGDVSSRHTVKVSSPSAPQSPQQSPTSDCNGCWDRAIATSCSYFDCLECVHGCGDSGYLLGYGKPMCTRFKEYSSNFLTEAGRRWLNDTLLCLMSELQVNYGKGISGINVCSKLMDDGHEWRNTCSLQAGYCQVSANPMNWWGMMRTFLTSDVWTWRLVPSSYKMTRACQERRAASAWQSFVSWFGLYDRKR